VKLFGVGFNGPRGRVKWKIHKRSKNKISTNYNIMNNDQFIFQLTWKIPLNATALHLNDFEWYQVTQNIKRNCQGCNTVKTFRHSKGKNFITVVKAHRVKNVKNNVKLTLFSSLLWRNKKWSTDSKGWNIVGETKSKVDGRMRTSGRSLPTPTLVLRADEI